MEKYFTLQYWLTIILLGLFVLIFVIQVIKILIIDPCIKNHRMKSKKWKYDIFKGKWEKIKEENNDYF